MSTYTPGPWHVAQGTDERDFIVAESTGSTVCEPNIQAFELDDFEPEVRRIGLAEAKANARLIAAAPDLLEALKECIEWLDPRLADEFFERISNIATAAIRKAERA